MMNQRCIFLVVTTLWASLSYSVAVFAQNDAKIAQLQQQVTRYQTDLESVREKTEESQKRLKSFQDDLDKKAEQYQKAKANAEQSPTPDNQLIMRNERRRFELAEVSIKSRVATVVRMEAKETELMELIESTKKQIEELKAPVAKTATAKRPIAKTEPERVALSANVTRLQKENERLRRLAKVEADRQKAKRLEEERLAKEAEERRFEEEAAKAEAIARARANQYATQLALEEEAKRRALVLEEAPKTVQQAAQKPKAQPAKQIKTARVDQTSQAKTSLQTAIQPAKKILTPDQINAERQMIQLRERIADGLLKPRKVENFVLSGDGVQQYSTFEHLGGNQYKASAKITGGQSRFVVNKRRYRLTLPEDDAGAEYIFLYDMNDETSPRLIAFKKTLIDENELLALDGGR